MKDHLGSTRSVVDNNGNVTEALWYDSFGKQTRIHNGASISKEKFTGKELDRDGAINGLAGMDLYYFGGRYYDADIGKWTSPDPLEEFFDSYNYVGNDPINFFDPWGLESDKPDNKKDKEKDKTLYFDDEYIFGKGEKKTENTKSTESYRHEPDATDEKTDSKELVEDLSNDWYLNIGYTGFSLEALFIGAYHFEVGVGANLNISFLTDKFSWHNFKKFWLDSRINANYLQGIGLGIGKGIATTSGWEGGVSKGAPEIGVHPRVAGLIIFGAATPKGGWLITIKLDAITSWSDLDNFVNVLDSHSGFFSNFGDALSFLVSNMNSRGISGSIGRKTASGEYAGGAVLITQGFNLNSPSAREVSEIVDYILGNE